MARFPKKEAEIETLATAMTLGLWNNGETYPNPPIEPMSLMLLLRDYRDAKNALMAARAAAEQATADKDEALENLIAALKADIRYAENTVNYADDKLKLIGWAGKKAATLTQPPGQTRLLEAAKQGNGRVYLDWKAPADGGKPRAYKIQRRLHSGGNWQDVATAIITETTLAEQPEKQELEYRVAALNKAGEGAVSNTVVVVL